MCDILSSVSLKEWAVAHPNVNPFTNCVNVAQFGGADFLWAEYKYRYGNREVFYPDDFVNEVERVFRINTYKFMSLLATTQANYDMFTNYQVEKIGSEETEFDKDKTHTGNDTLTLNSTSTERPAEVINKVTTPTTEITETETPELTKTEVSTPRVVDSTLKTPNTQTETVETPRVSTTAEHTPLGYTESTSKTTFDNLSHKPVEMVTHTPSTGSEITVTTPTTGTNTTVSTTTGTETTELSHTGTNTVQTDTTGTNTKVTGYTNGNVTEQETHSGQNVVQKTGTEMQGYNSSNSEEGTETLTFRNRMDKGFMYRPPQDAIKDERTIAMFSLVDIILKDVEAATLVSVY